MTKVVLRARQDPVFYAHHIIGKQTNPIQARILRAIRDNRHVAVPSCHGSGKTWVAAMGTMWNTSCFPGALSITTAPSDRQVRRGTWKEVRAMYADAKIPLGGEVPNVQDWEIGPDWYCLGFTAPERDANRFRGMHANRILIVVDEAGGVSDEIYTGIKGALTGETPRALYIGHPTEPVGEFANAITGKIPNTKVIRIDAFSTPNFVNPGVTIEDIRSGRWEEKWEAYKPPSHEIGLVDPSWVWQRWMEWCDGREEGEKTSWKWQALVLGLIPENVDDQLIWREWLNAAEENVEEHGDLVAAIDPAGPGDNETTVGWRRGGQLIGVKGFGDADPRGKVVALLRHLDPTEVRIDENGIGWNFKLHLQDLGFNVEGINFGKTPEGNSRKHTKELKERFKLCRDHYFWHLRDRFKEERIGGIRHTEMRTQLGWFKYGHDAQGRVKVITKDQLRDQGLPSPDWGDMLAMLYAPLPQKADKKLSMPEKTTRPSYWKVG